MQIVHRTKVSKKKIGKAIIHNHNLEQHEFSTVCCLIGFGFDVEVLAPSNIPKTKNPDLLMLGTYWEMKGGTTFNRATIQTKFRKATKQSGGKAIFDLRTVRRNRLTVEKTIMKLFRETREMRRVMIIQDDENLLDILK